MARILLADDDRGALDFVRRALELDGHAVATAEDGNEALGLFAKTAFDVLVTDVQMPGLDGISLVEMALSQTPGLRVVMMSGYPEILEKARGLKAPAIRFVPKPFTIEQLRSEIRAVLAG